MAVAIGRGTLGAIARAELLQPTLNVLATLIAERAQKDAYEVCNGLALKAKTLAALLDSIGKAEWDEKEEKVGLLFYCVITAIQVACVASLAFSVFTAFTPVKLALLLVGAYFIIKTKTIQSTFALGMKVFGENPESAARLSQGLEAKLQDFSALRAAVILKHETAKKDLDRVLAARIRSSYEPDSTALEKAQREPIQQARAAMSGLWEALCPDAQLRKGSNDV